MNIQEEWNNFINELDELMQTAPGNIERIKDCTMIEEWRVDQGYSPFDGDLDNDNWKTTYELLEEENAEYIAPYRDYANRVGLDKAAMALKYPLVNKYMEEHSI